MDFQDASLKDLLKIFSIQSGLNFIASEGVQERKVTLYFHNVPIKEAMDKLFRANNLYYELDKKSNIFIVKDWGKSQVDTITKIYNLKYQSVPSSSLNKELSEVSKGASGADLAGSIKQRLSEYGKLSEDTRTNSLIITDIPTRFPIIEDLIARLDVPQVQIMLEMEMLDVDKNKVDAMGFKFGKTPMAMVYTGPKLDVGFPFSGTILDKRGITTSGTVGNLDFSTAPYTMQLDFLRSQSDTKTLARPKILTLNNETAEIKIATQKSLNSSTTTNTEVSTSTAGVERQEIGVTLRVTPQVNPDTGEITMVISSKASDVTSTVLSNSSTVSSTTSKTTTTNAQTVFDPDQRTTKSIVRVRDSETVVLGGLIRNDFSATITKLPFLGDLPILGTFFRHKSVDKNEQRELIIFITPHIIRNGKIELAQAKNMVVPEREQDLASAGTLNRRKIIEASLNSFSSKK